MGTGTDPDQIAAQEALAEEFNSTHDDIEVEFLIVPVEEAPERYLAMLSGGNAPQLVGPNGISTVAQFFDTWADVAPLVEAASPASAVLASGVAGFDMASLSKARCWPSSVLSTS